MELTIKPNSYINQWSKVIDTFSLNIVINGPTRITINGTQLIDRGTKVRVKQFSAEFLGEVVDSYFIVSGLSAIVIEKTSGIFNYSQIISVEKLLDEPSYYLDGEFNLELNIRIFDLKELKRSGAYTKTIDIPFTDVNNNIFSQLFNVNVEGGMNPKKKNDCIISDGGILIASGFLQLQEIDLPNKIYKCVFYGDNKNLFDDIGDKFIFGNVNNADDLNFDTLIHNKFSSDLDNSWDNNEDWVYGLVNDDLNSWTLSTMKAGMDIAKFKLWVRMKSIVDAIFNKWGYTYESDFFNTTEFSDIFVLPSLDSGVNAAISKWTIGDPPTTSYTLTKGVDTDLVFSTPAGDPFGAYDNLTNEFTIPYSDNFGVSLMLNFTKQTDIRSSTEKEAIRNAGVIKIIPIVYRRGVEVFRNNNWFQISGGVVQGAFGSSLFYDAKNITRLQVANLPIGFELRTGDKLRIMVRYDSGIWTSLTVIGNKWLGNNAVPTTQDQFPNDPVNFIQLQSTRESANPLSLFGNIKQADFLGDVFKMFNLYIKPDKFNRRKFLIEPRDIFYKKGKTVSDLEYDRSDVNISYLIDLAAKNYKFSYSEGDDIPNKDWKTANRGRIFGDATVELDNDFAINEKKIDLKAAPTFYAPISSASNIQLPNYIGSSKSGKLRYAYYNGKVETGQELRYNLPLNASSNTSFTASWYPAFDNYQDFRNFDSSGLLFRTSNDDFKEQSLYFNYWDNEIETYADKNTHILTLRVRMNANIYSRIDFNDIYYFEIGENSHYYILLSIDGYDPTADTIVTMKFLSYYDFRNSKPKRSRFGSIDTGGLGKNPGSVTDTVKNAGVVGGGGGVVIRDGLNGGVFVGSDIMIGNNKNFIIVGDDIIVADGKDNVYNFGGSDLTIEASNVVSWNAVGKTFSNNDVFLFNDLNPVLSERDVNLIPTPEEGMFAYAGPTQGIVVYNGSSWINSNGTTPGPTIDNYNWFLPADIVIATSSTWYDIVNYTIPVSGTWFISAQSMIGGTVSGGIDYRNIVSVRLGDNGGVYYSSNETTVNYPNIGFSGLSMNTIQYFSAGEIIYFQAAGRDSFTVYSDIQSTPTGTKATQFNAVRIA